MDTRVGSDFNTVYPEAVWVTTKRRGRKRYCVTLLLFSSLFAGSCRPAESRHEDSLSSWALVVASGPSPGRSTLRRSLGGPEFLLAQ